MCRCNVPLPSDRTTARSIVVLHCIRFLLNLVLLCGTTTGMLTNATSFTDERADFLREAASRADLSTAQRMSLVSMRSKTSVTSTTRMSNCCTSAESIRRVCHILTAPAHHFHDPACTTDCQFPPDRRPAACMRFRNEPSQRSVG
jgi:hypothetical protein